MSRRDPEYLFVYGTLRRECACEQAQLIERYCEFVADGHMQGRIYVIDGYPGVVESASQQDQVTGALYRIVNHAELLPSLDRYEECSSDFPQPHEYHRKQVNIETDDGQTVHAWVYVYNRDVTLLRRIESGDYLDLKKL